MGVRELIVAALAREDLTAEERRRLVHRIKCEAFEQLLGSDLERTFTLPNGWSITIAEPGVRFINGPVLRFLLTVRRPNGNVVGSANAEQVVINPPIMVPDGTEPNPDYDPDNPASSPTRPKYKEDLKAALREIVRGIVTR